MNEHEKKIVVETVFESAVASLPEGQEIEEVRFYELGIDSIGMLSILLRLEEKLSVSLESLGDQLEAPGTFGELFVLVDRLIGNNYQIQKDINEISC